MKLSPDEKTALVDELGQLNQEIAPLEGKKKRAAEIREQIRSWYGAQGATKTFTETGHKFIATIGARENETKIKSMVAVFARLGQAGFLARCAFTLKALKEAVKIDEYNALVSTERTGSRPVDTYAVAKAK